MSQPVEFWFEFASSYSYPAAMRVEAACAERGVPLIWRPFLLGPVFAAQGLETSPFLLNPIKGAYMWRDIERLCAAEGLAFQMQSSFPRGSILAARVACYFAEADWIGDFVRGVYTANFAQDEDIGAAGFVPGLLQAMGQDAEAVIAAATSPESKAALRAQTEAAMAKGIFGAPSFTIGAELFWGHDRMDAALDWAQQ